MVRGVHIIYILEKFFIAMAVLAGVLVCVYFSKPLSIPKPYERAQDVQPSLALTLPGAVNPEEEDATVPVVQRDLFNVSGISKEAIGIDGIPEPGTLPANFKVVGIMIGETPQIAIEDTAARQTYFIAKGSQMSGIEVLDLSRDRAILKYQGQEISLMLGGK